MTVVGITVLSESSNGSSFRITTPTKAGLSGMDDNSNRVASREAYIAEAEAQRELDLWNAGIHSAKGLY